MNYELFLNAECIDTKINFRKIEMHKDLIGGLDLATVEEIAELCSYYSGEELMAMRYCTMILKVIRFVNTTHSVRGKLSRLVYTITGCEIIVKNDIDCSLFFAIFYAKSKMLRVMLEKNQETLVRAQ